MNTGYIDAAMFLVIYTAAIYVFAYLVKRTNVFWLTSIGIIGGVFLILLYLFIIEKASIHSLVSLPSKTALVWLSAAGFLSFIGGNLFSLINLKEGNAGTNSLLAPFITIVSSILAIFFLNEKVSANASIGIIITSFSVLYYLAKPVANKKINVKSLVSGVICVLFISADIICSIKGASKTNISLFHSIFIKLFAMLPFACLLLFFQSNKKQPSYSNNNFILLLVFGILLQVVLPNFFWFRASLKLGTTNFQIIIALLPFCIGLVDAFLIKKKQLDKTFYLSALFAIIGIAIFFWL